MAGIPLAEYARDHPALGTRAGGSCRMSATALPDGSSSAFYGDDFTGSTAVDGGADLRRPADGALPRRCRRRSGWRGSPAIAASASPASPAPQSPAWMDGTCRRSSELLAALEAPVVALQGLLDLRLGAAGRLDRAGDRPRGADPRRRLASRSSSAPRRSRATRPSATCSRPVGRRGLPARPPPDHVPPPGHADGRGGRPAPPREADRQVHRPRRSSSP